jgi:hypothetical protein
VQAIDHCVQGIIDFVSQDSGHTSGRS